MAWTHALLTGLLLACVFTQETAVIRLFSFDGETNIEGKLQPVLSLCTDIPAEADFLLSLSPPCLETPSNMRLFLVSRQAAGLLDLELVQVTASLRPRLGELPVWEITLPAAISLGNLHRIALGVETQSLACPSPAPTLQMLISTGFAWDCVSPSSCPSRLSSAAAFPDDSGYTDLCSSVLPLLLTKHELHFAVCLHPRPYKVYVCVQRVALSPAHAECRGVVSGTAAGAAVFVALGCGLFR